MGRGVHLLLGRRVERSEDERVSEFKRDKLRKGKKRREDFIRRDKKRGAMRRGMERR